MVVTNLYPNCNEENRGVFIRQLVERLAGEFEISVICPIPWRPKFLVNSSQDIPKQDVINGIKVEYPRHLVIPKMMRFSYGWLMYLALLPVLKRMHKTSSIDLISAHWLYPDAFGAMKAAKKIHIPIVVHALGCDINEYSKYWLRRIQISQVLKTSDRVVVKSGDLAIQAKRLGAPINNIRTIMNGVDKDKFYPRSMIEARNEIGLSSSTKYLLFVGNLQVEKGLVFLLKALPKVVELDFKLLVVGTGPQEKMMCELVESLGISSNVVFLGSLRHDQIPIYLNAVDALCLPSLREGCPNIVLESLSCGTPVLASNVGAVSAMITDSKKGIIVAPEDSSAISDNIPRILALKNENIVDFYWQNWEENAQAITEVFNELIT